MVPQWVGGGLSLQPEAKLLFVGALWPALDSLESLFDEVSWAMSIVELLCVSGVPEEEKAKKQRKRREEEKRREEKRREEKRRKGREEVQKKRR